MPRQGAIPHAGSPVPSPGEDPDLPERRRQLLAQESMQDHSDRPARRFLPEEHPGAPLLRECGIPGVKCDAWVTSEVSVAKTATLNNRTFLEAVTYINLLRI